MDKVILNQNGLKKSSAAISNSIPDLGYGEKLIQNNLYYSIRAKTLAVGIFLFYFFENGSLGIIPEKYYMIYRSVRISDLILYTLVIYSLYCIKEYKDLFKSKSFTIVKVLLAYYVFEFIYSAVNYKFNVIEYFFRLKLLWTSFLIFPFLLLLKRDGLGFLIKLIFPAAVLSNILYILSAVTGTAFLPDINIIKQQLEENLEVTRVYGGTFFGEFLFLGFIYYWFTKKFRVYQLFFALLFIIPHILAMGRASWARFIFTIVIIGLISVWKKKKIKILLKQAVVLSIFSLALMYSFVKFLPDSDYLVHALETRIMQGRENVKYDEGTYGTRVVLDNDILINVWLQSNRFVGIGMHPMYVYRPESRREEAIYSALSDVVWPGVLAVYGVIGFVLALFFQMYYIKTSFKLIKKSMYQDTLTCILIILMARMVFTTFITYSYLLTSIGIQGLGSVMSFLIAAVVYSYEKQKSEPDNTNGTKPKSFDSKWKYYYSYSKTYKLKE